MLPLPIQFSDGYEDTDVLFLKDLMLAYMAACAL